MLCHKIMKLEEILYRQTPSTRNDQSASCFQKLLSDSCSLDGWQMVNIVRDNYHTSDFGNCRLVGVSKTLEKMPINHLIMESTVCRLFSKQLLDSKLW